MTLSSSAIYRPIGPRDPAVETRLERFKRMNAFIAARGGWVTSLPGDREIRFETLPKSLIPDDLRAIGHRVFADGDGERILPSAVQQKFVAGPDGEFVPLTEGSTRSVVHVATHAGIVRVRRYAMVLTDAETERN